MQWIPLKPELVTLLPLHWTHHMSLQTPLLLCHYNPEFFQNQFNQAPC
jgi:hypothetical protein